MAAFIDRARSIVATAGKVARLQGAIVEATVLEKANASLIETGYDNWNGGTTQYTLMLELPIPAYAALENPEAVEKAVHRRVLQLTRIEGGNYITEVVVSPTLDEEARPTESRSGTEAPSEDVPSFWQPGFFRLFITHLAAHRASAHRLKEALAPFQVAAFVAHDDIEPTREWQSEIERALRTMDALVAIVTPGLRESSWCDQEVGFAIGRGKLVLPVKAGADPHGFMGKYQALLAQGLDAPTLAERIVQILLQHSSSSDRMCEALVDRLAGSASWDSSKRTLAILEKAPALNASQVARLIAAIDQNVDVRDAWGVPDRIKALVGRIGERSV